MDPVHAVLLVLILSAFIVAGAFLAYREGFNAGAGHAGAVFNAVESGKAIARAEAGGLTVPAVAVADKAQEDHADA